MQPPVRVHDQHLIPPSSHPLARTHPTPASEWGREQTEAGELCGQESPLSSELRRLIQAAWESSPPAAAGRPITRQEPQRQVRLKIPEASGLPVGLMAPELRFRILLLARAACPRGDPPHPRCILGAANIKITTVTDLRTTVPRPVRTDPLRRVRTFLKGQANSPNHTYQTRPRKTLCSWLALRAAVPPTAPGPGLSKGSGGFGQRRAEAVRAARPAGEGLSRAPLPQKRASLSDGASAE